MRRKDVTVVRCPTDPTWHQILPLLHCSEWPSIKGTEKENLSALCVYMCVCVSVLCVLCARVCVLCVSVCVYVFCVYKSVFCARICVMCTCVMCACVCVVCVSVSCVRVSVSCVCHVCVCLYHVCMCLDVYLQKGMNNSRRQVRLELQLQGYWRLYKAKMGQNKGIPLNKNWTSIQHNNNMQAEERTVTKLTTERMKI